MNEERNYVKEMEDLVLSESDLYSESESLDQMTTHIKNICALSAQITEAKKVENERFKTELEVELKNRMNERDNEVKKETIAQELKQRKNELIAGKIESGAVLGANIAKNVAQAAWIGGVTAGEYNGYSERSQAVKALMDFGKTSIKTRF